MMDKFPQCYCEICALPDMDMINLARNIESEILSNFSLYIVLEAEFYMKDMIKNAECESGTTTSIR